MNEIIGYILIGIGIFFNFFGCFGLIRLPDIYNRLQAGTKSVTFGTIFVLLGVFAISGLNSMGVKAIICMVFILITSPTAAHAISRGAHRYGVKLWEKSIIDQYKEDKEGEKKSKK